MYLHLIYAILILPTKGRPLVENITPHDPPQVVPAMNQLPGDRRQWPREAGEAYEHLLRELDRWSRDNDWPHTTNSWIAEEAVRRGW